MGAGAQAPHTDSVFTGFDHSIALWVNGFIGRSPAFDAVVTMVAFNGFFKGAVLVAMLWWLWFRQESRDRDAVLTSVVAATLGLALARALACFLPFRDRPFHEVALHLRVATGLDATTPQLWSSFPSDHATAFFALATGIFFASRRAGVAAFAWAAVVVCAPRLYLGLHYPTDLLAGATLGVLTASVVWIGAARRVVSDVASRVERRYRPLFYTSLFVWSYSMAEMFDGVRRVVVLFAR